MNKILIKIQIVKYQYTNMKKFKKNKIICKLKLVININQCLKYKLKINKYKRYIVKIINLKYLTIKIITI